MIKEISFFKVNTTIGGYCHNDLYCKFDSAKECKVIITAEGNDRYLVQNDEIDDVRCRTLEDLEIYMKKKYNGRSSACFCPED